MFYQLLNYQGKNLQRHLSQFLFSLASQCFPLELGPQKHAECLVPWVQHQVVHCDCRSFAGFAFTNQIHQNTAAPYLHSEIIQYQQAWAFPGPGFRSSCTQSLELHSAHSKASCQTQTGMCLEVRCKAACGCIRLHTAACMVVPGSDERPQNVDLCKGNNLAQCGAVVDGLHQRLASILSLPGHAVYLYYFFLSPELVYWLHGLTPCQLMCDR